MNQSQLKVRFNAFAHACVKLVAKLPQSDQLSSIIRYQLLKSGTSSAANYSAACVSQSRASFRAKISIVIEEMDESRFWIQFIMDEQLLSITDTDPLLKECNELLSIVISTRMTMDKRK